jgi:chemotaxis protein MotB
MSGGLGRKPKGGNKDEGLWLLSFCDLSFILLSFFVLLLSQSKLDKPRVEKLADDMKPPAKVEPQKKKAEPKNLVEISDELERIVKKLKIEESVSIDRDVDGIAVELKEGMVFKSGSAVSNTQTKNVIDSVLKIISATPQKYKLVIEGHTDDVPIKTRDFKDNWELSAARGHALLKQFRDRGVNESRMSIVAYAQTRPKAEINGLIGQDLNAARAQNRRVVIRIE